MIVQNSYLQKGLIHYFPLSEIATRVDSAVTYVLDQETLMLGVPTAITYGDDSLGRENEVSIFNGTTSQILYSDLVNDLTGDLSICLRMKLDSYGSNDVGVCIDSSKLIIHVDGVDGANRIKVSRNGSNWAVSDEVLNVDDEITVLVTSTDGGVTNIYVGHENHIFALDGDADQDGGTPVASTFMRIGNNLAGTSGFEGYMRDILIWNWVLDENTRLLARDILT